ncbi:MAG: N-acetyl-gamma-glutamyl-phosphate reductase, partial [Synechococcales cyanobacterium RM1_1_8]|nr:N-acetyl-gamma-glutamyl-phosphate reductase [Synechococcales cyanobacterium RM1_1_8]
CYGLERTAGGQGQGLDQEAVQASVYGLPELYRDRLPAARLVAVPGCYSTASLLAIAPLLKRGLIQPETLIIDAKLGGSGLAQALQPQVRLAEVEQSIAAYGVARHRQTPEIEQICSELLGHDVMVQFTPHLVPRVRGLLSTVYGTLRDPGLVREDLLTIYRAFYQRSPWVRILPANTYPQTQWTWGTNCCDIGIEVDSRTGRVIVMGAIDNLMKGEASQAVQCLNLMMGWDETLGLSTMALFP